MDIFEFNAKGFQAVKEFPLGRNWPVVYIIENSKEAYVGETTNVYYRCKQHSKNEDRRRLERVYVITDEKYNKSATLDIESLLIQYLGAEGSLVLQNGNRGLVDHNYYEKPEYQAKFKGIWRELMKEGLVSKELEEIKNSDIFKYSPFKALSEDQLEVAAEIVCALQGNSGTHIVKGGPGTGKSILAIYLFKALADNEGTKDFKIGLVVPMSSLRQTIKQVFKHVKGLKASMVIGPSDVVKEKYDVLIVDEAHRLQQRRNIVNFKSFDDVNKKLGLGKNGTQLDWILKSSKHQILFYDKNQTIKPADIHAKRFENLEADVHELTEQHRVKGGNNFIDFVNSIFSNEKTKVSDFGDFDFKICTDLGEMVKDIRAKDKSLGLCRLVAGYAWEWRSKKNPDDYDIKIGDQKLRWNSILNNWVNSPKAPDEVGCIHTVQGYDLNYIGIIIGPELSYDHKAKKLKVIKENYKDFNGYRGIEDEQELEDYILNIYKTLLTRGIMGCYVYCVDKELERYLMGEMVKK